jgi:hypothetical protein
MMADLIAIGDHYGYLPFNRAAVPEPYTLTPYTLKP